MKGNEFLAQVASQPPFSRMHPKIAAFFKEYLSKEKVVDFGGRRVLNTNFPPYPSGAFDNMVEQFNLIGDAAEGRLYSVTMAVTNRCMYNCWHCSNAGRAQKDLALKDWNRLIGRLKEMSAVMVTLTGGEPLLRGDLDEIARACGDRACVIVDTTGFGLTPDRARRLRDSGVFGMGVSLDSKDAEEHDRLRGFKGAFDTALQAIRIAGKNGIYPYIVSVATREFLQPERFHPFMRFAGKMGAREVHLLEPAATGRLTGRTDVLLTRAERSRIFDYQKQYAHDDGLPILSAFAYVESADAFGCGAGLTHLYIDGGGEVCPCNLVPLSFGNFTREPLADILARMRCHFCKPRTGCVGRLLGKHSPDGRPPQPPSVSEEVCKKHLPQRHPLPRFFKVRQEAQSQVGREELQAAYNRVHGDYDDFWLTEAARPIDDLVQRLGWTGRERVFEAGCGTGYATALLAARTKSVLAADLSEGMLTEARRRLRAVGLDNVLFAAGDALAMLEVEGPFDVVFSSWVLGYIPLKPFFAAASRALTKGGQLGLVVHRDNSPREPLEIFAEIAAQDPSALEKRVAFDFPRDAGHLREEVGAARLKVVDLWEGAVVFRYRNAKEVLEHLLKSGAGTAFYEAVVPARRKSLTERFVRMLTARHRRSGGYDVKHDYLACIAAMGTQQRRMRR